MASTESTRDARIGKLVVCSTPSTDWIGTLLRFDRNDWAHLQPSRQVLKGGFGSIVKEEIVADAMATKAIGGTIDNPILNPPDEGPIEIRYALVYKATGNSVMMSHQDDRENPIEADTIEELLDLCGDWSDLGKTEFVRRLAAGTEGMGEYKIVELEVKQNPLAAREAAIVASYLKD